MGRGWTRWLWFGMAILFVAVVAIAIVWAIVAEDESVVAAGADHEVTSVHVVDQDDLVTVAFVGGDADLDPDVMVDYDHEVTTLRLVDQEALVTVPFVGVSGELSTDK